MFTIMPENDPQIIASYLPQSDNTALLVYKDRGENVGHIVLERRGDRYFIIGFFLKECNIEKPVDTRRFADADALIRSAGSYALNRSVGVLCCEKKEYFSLLKRFDFEEIDNYLTINLQDLFKVCKNCK